MATHSSILAWRIPWTEEPGGLQSLGSQRVGHGSSDLAPPFIKSKVLPTDSNVHPDSKNNKKRKKGTTCEIWELLLLLSRFSRVRLCVTPQTAAHQAPPSLGFSRQEHWSGLPFPSPVHGSEK